MVDGSVRDYWDSPASTFDSWLVHGLADPAMRQAWRALLAELMPERAAVVADLGCATGSPAILLAAARHAVTGIDLAPAMVEPAAEMAVRHGVDVRFDVGDAAEPSLEPGGFDVVPARHVVWTLPDPAAGPGRVCAVGRHHRRRALSSVWPPMTARQRMRNRPSRAGSGTACDRTAAIGSVRP